MRCTWGGLAGLLVTVLCQAGCATRDTELRKPPPPQPEFVVPPTDEARWSSPPAYPEKFLNQGPTKMLDPLGSGNLKNPGSARLGGS
jgi:hypothetical protein